MDANLIEVHQGVEWIDIHKFKESIHSLEILPSSLTNRPIIYKLSTHILMNYCMKFIKFSHTPFVHIYKQKTTF